MGRIGSRLPAQRVVAGVRARILARIQLEPGIAFLGLHAHFPLGHGALQHHLGVLAARGHVTSAKVGRFRRYYWSHSTFVALKEAHALACLPIPRRILSILDAGPGLCQRHVAAQFPEVTRQTVAYHLRRLAAAGLVRVAEAGNFTRYYPAEPLWRLEGSGNGLGVELASCDPMPTPLVRGRTVRTVREPGVVDDAPGVV